MLSCFQKKYSKRNKICRVLYYLFASFSYVNCLFRHNYIMCENQSHNLCLRGNIKIKIGIQHSVCVCIQSMNIPHNFQFDQASGGKNMKRLEKAHHLMHQKEIIPRHNQLTNLRPCNTFLSQLEDKQECTTGKISKLTYCCSKLLIDIL